MRDCARAVLLALLALSVGGSALAAPGSSYASLFPDGEAEGRGLLRVPLVAGGGKLALVNESALATHGLAEADRFGAQIRADFAQLSSLRLATREEIAAGKVTHYALATRYHDWDREGSSGSVRGDGKAGLVSELPIRDARAGRITGIAEVQLKGELDTGLAPVDVPVGDVHHGGLLALDNGIAEGIRAAYLKANGVRTNDWLGVLEIPGTAWHGRIVRMGNFLRLAHLNRFRDDPKALRALLDYANDQLSLEMGRGSRMSFAGLYQQLAERKAGELADLWWSRAVHHSTTYDNIGLFETVDLGTLSTVNRPSGWRAGHTSVGFVDEPDTIMKDYYAGELRELMVLAAAPEERAALRRIDARRMTAEMLRWKMAARALEHAGFDPDDVRGLMKHRRGAALAFYDAVRALAATIEPGATERHGPQGKEVDRISRYDVFAALGRLGAIASSSQVEARVATLTRALAPLGAAQPKDDDAARRLLASFAPLAELVTRGMTDAQRAAKWILVADEAARINAPVGELEHSHVGKLAYEMSQAHYAGQRSEPALRALIRRNTRRGPTTPPAIAIGLRRGTLPRTPDGFVVLSSETERGVRIDEISDGRQDRIRVTVQHDGLGLGDLGQYRLHYKTRGEEWIRVDPDPQGPPGTFTLPMHEAPEHFVCELSDRAQKKWWGNEQGILFGSGMRPVLASSLVRAELALYAQRRGEVRGGEDEALAAALRGRGRREVKTASIPSRLLRIELTAGARALRLPPPRTVRPVGKQPTLGERLRRIVGLGGAKPARAAR